jgi:uncharacterized protein (TIGR02145 family)
MEAGTSHWAPPHFGANNNSGFTALPGGYRDPTGLFSSLGSWGYWWSSSDSNSLMTAWYRAMYSGANFFRNWIASGNGFSVRCVHDY